ncbi:MAG: carbohydrate ABC transporter permease, partial [Sphaerochaetaceae bacterium]|nr:carbohydrate ABC transporter permease [Sphaerochaetaceae bacterium]
MEKNTSKHIIGRTVAYIVFISWTLITILPIFWMAYSSFKSNEELTRNIYAFPYELFHNEDDVYEIIAPQLNVTPDYDTETDTRERMIIESTSISPGRRLMVHFLVKEDLPQEILSRDIGDTLTLSELPKQMRREISRKTMLFNYTSAIQRGGLAQKFLNSLIYAGVSTFLINALSL